MSNKQKTYIYNISDKKSFFDVGMTKRHRAIASEKCIKKNVIGILKIYQIPGLIELVYSFFINGDVLSKQLFFDLRCVCKEFQIYANRLVALLCPTLSSSYDIDFWSRLTPNVKSIKSSLFLQKLSFSNLRKLSFYNSNAVDVQKPEVDVRNWQCPLLEDLTMFCVTTIQSGMITMAQQFLHLKNLSVYVHTQGCFCISNFALLEKLQIFKQYEEESTMELHFVNLPCLQELDIHECFKSLHFYDVSNLKTIESDDFTVDHIIFHNPMLCLTSMDLGSAPLLALDSYDNVKWENMQTLHFFSSDCIEKRLTNCKNVTNLHIAFPPPDCLWLSTILCLQETLQELQVQWEEEFVLDCKLLLNFRNIKNLDLQGKCLHFEDLLSLPKLQIFDCSIRYLLKFEIKLFLNWKQKHKISAMVSKEA